MIRELSSELTQVACNVVHTAFAEDPSALEEIENSGKGSEEFRELVQMPISSQTRSWVTANFGDEHGTLQKAVTVSMGKCLEVVLQNARAKGPGNHRKCEPWCPHVIDLFDEEPNP
jgi:hypothetical protein